MLFDLGSKSVTLLFFFVQGLVFSALLLYHGWRQEQTASRWLGLFLFLCCLYITPWMCGHANWYAKDGYREVLFFVPFQQLFLLGPVIYFYTRSLLDPTDNLRCRDWWHFAPAAAYLLYSLIVFVVDVAILPEYYFYADGRDKDLAPWYQVTGLTSLTGYALLSIAHYQRYRRRIFQELSYADSVLFSWIRRFLIALVLIIFLRTGFLFLFPEWGSFGKKFWYYLAFSSLFYYIAIAGYTHAVRSHFPLRVGANRNRPATQPTAAPDPLSAPATTDAPDPELLAAVAQFITSEAGYRNPELTRTDVAEALGVTTKTVSALINQGFGKNFNDYVNEFRVAAVQERFATGEHHRHTILSIALDCGFNSKTTFNRVFKRLTGQTPVQYLRQLERDGGEK